MNNKNLHNAKRNKDINKDEYYTRGQDIDNEIRHHKERFKDAVIYMNCDDPIESEFFQAFALRFHTYGLKKIIATCYKNTNSDLFTQHKESRGCVIEYCGGGVKAVIRFTHMQKSIVKN